MINFEEFQKIDMRVARIVAVEKVEGSEKLLKLKVDLGTETKQIIAGIQQQYLLEDLVEREIVVVMNLELKVPFIKKESPR